MDKTGTEAPKAPTFDIVRYYNDNKSYYGDIPLEDVAQDALSARFYKQYPDYNSWKQAAGIEPLIQEDTKRRTPSFSSKLMGAIPFHYEEELYRDAYIAMIGSIKLSNKDRARMKTLLNGCQDRNLKICNMSVTSWKETGNMQNSKN